MQFPWNVITRGYNCVKELGVAYPSVVVPNTHPNPLRLGHRPLSVVALTGRESYGVREFNMDNIDHLH